MNILRRIVKPKTCQEIIKRCTSDNFYEPPYLAVLNFVTLKILNYLFLLLQEMVSQIPTYDALNIFLKGYDYPILESYQKFVHKLLKNMEVEVEDCWAMPPQHLKITTLKPRSELMDSEYNLKLYERVVQIVDVTSTQVSLFIIIEINLPKISF